MSRADSGSFLGTCTENEIVKKNPFASITPTGVGQLVRIARGNGNQTRPGIKLGPASAGRQTRRRKSSFLSTDFRQ